MLHRKSPPACCGIVRTSRTDEDSRVRIKMVFSLEIVDTGDHNNTLKSNALRNVEEEKCKGQKDLIRPFGPRDIVSAQLTSFMYFVARPAMLKSVPAESTRMALGVHI